MLNGSEIIMDGDKESPHYADMKRPATAGRKRGRAKNRHVDTNDERFCFLDEKGDSLGGLGEPSTSGKPVFSQPNQQRLNSIYSAQLPSTKKSKKKQGKRILYEEEDPLETAKARQGRGHFPPPGKTMMARDQHRKQTVEHNEETPTNTGSDVFSPKIPRKTGFQRSEMPSTKSSLVGNYSQIHSQTKQRPSSTKRTRPHHEVDLPMAQAHSPTKKRTRPQEKQSVVDLMGDSGDEREEKETGKDDGTMVQDLVKTISNEATIAPPAPKRLLIRKHNAYGSNDLSNDKAKKQPVRGGDSNSIDLVDTPPAKSSSMSVIETMKRATQKSYSAIRGSLSGEKIKKTKKKPGMPIRPGAALDGGKLVSKLPCVGHFTEHLTYFFQV